MVTLFLTMSAGVLLVIVKVLPVLGGFHTEGGHQDFRSSSPWLLENAAESASVLAEVSPVVETCSGASSSLLHNHFVEYSPELTDQSSSNASVCAKGQPVDPGGLRDPQIVNKIQVERRWREPNTAGTSGHAAPPVSVGKERIISALSRLM